LSDDQKIGSKGTTEEKKRLKNFLQVLDFSAFFRLEGTTGTCLTEHFGFMVQPQRHRR
jgi:hypothetical protein